MKRLTPG